MNAARQPTPVMILGIPVHPLTMEDVLLWIERSIAARKPRYLVTANVHFATLARRDAELHRILCEADLVLCDGTPLLWAGRCLGGSLPERVAGSDLLLPLLERSAARGFRVFFLGSTPEVLWLARRRAELRYPGIAICGTLAPAHGELSAFDEGQIRGEVARARPDLLLVALGCPKQEKLIARHYQSFGVPCSLGVGASLDFLAGQFPRAPGWMKRSGTEWLFRLLQEPRRLLPRYAADFAFYFPSLAAQLVRGAGGARRIGARPPPNLRSTAWYTWQGQVDGAALREGRAPLPLPRAGEQTAAVSLEGVERIDASGLGALVHAWKLCRERGAQLLLFRPSPVVTRELEALGLERVLRVAHTVAQAREAAESHMRPTPARSLSEGGGSPRLPGA